MHKKEQVLPHQKRSALQRTKTRLGDCNGSGFVKSSGFQGCTVISGWVYCKTRSHSSRTFSYSEASA